MHRGGEDKVGGLNRNRNGSQKGQDGMKIRALRVFLTPNFDTSFVERYERYDRNESLLEVVQVALVDQKKSTGVGSKGATCRHDISTAPSRTVTTETARQHGTSGRAARA